jgi:carboxylesterase
MPQFPWLDPSPFFLRGGRVGCLLIHGFTGSPPEMRPMGDYLAEKGLTVSGPLLAGHGTTPQDLARTAWQDWYTSVEAAFQELEEQCSRVFVGGFSLGSLLALHLGAHHAVTGLVLMSPAVEVSDRRSKLVPLLRHVVKFMPKDTDPQHSDLTDKEAYKRFWSYDVYPVAGVHQLLRLQKVVRAELGHIEVPTLVIYATGDMSISPQSGPAVYDGIGAQDKELVALHNSGHGLVVDSECDSVFQKVHDWIAAH